MDEHVSPDTIGLLRRELRDVRAVVSNVDHRTRKLIEPHSIHRVGGLVARLAACQLLARSERREPTDVAKQHFAADRDLARLIELKGAVAPLDGLASSLA